MAATLVSGSFYLSLRILAQAPATGLNQASDSPVLRGKSLGAYAGLGICLGAALLAKATAILVIPVVLAGMIWSRWQITGVEAPNREGLRGVPGNRSPRSLTGMAVMLVACFGVCGWHYWRVWSEFGTPLIGVWDPRTGFSWWQDDGYRTGAYYCRFGVVLTHPWFGSFRSFLDGLYSTLWGDGLLGGSAREVFRPPWDYELMSIGYWLALPMSLVVLGGVLQAVTKLVVKPRAEWVMTLGLAFLVMLAMVQFSLKVPYYCNVKAFYGMAGLVPFCAFFALGTDFLLRRGPAGRFLLWTFLGLWCLNSYASFWIRRSSEPALIFCAENLMQRGHPEEAKRLLGEVLQRNPRSVEARWLRVSALMAGGKLEQAGAEVDPLLVKEFQNADLDLALAGLRFAQHRGNEAVEYANRAVSLAPGNPQAYEVLGNALLSRGKVELAIAQARQGLAEAPANANLHYIVGQGLATQGKWKEAIAHYRLTLDLGRRDAEVRYNLGYALRNQEQLQPAAEEFEEALRIKPELPLAHYHLGCVLLEQKRPADARAHFEEALRLQPDYPQARLELEKLKEETHAGASQ